MTLNTLASQVLRDRLARTDIIGSTKKGRIIVRLVGEASEAERQWETLQGLMALCGLLRRSFVTLERGL